MTTPNVTINTTAPAVQRRDIERETEEAEKRRQKGAAIPVEDGYEAVSTKPLAGAGESARPPQKDRSRHAQIKHAHSNLQKACVAAGGDSGKAIDEKTATNLIKKLEEDIATLHENGDPKQEIGLKEKHLEDLKEALQVYQMAHAEGSAEETATTQAVRGKGEAEEAHTETSAREKELWAGVEKIVGKELTKGKEIEQVRKAFTEQMRTKVLALQSTVKELTAKQKELETKLKTATPAEKTTLEKALKEVTTQLTQANQKLVQLQKAVNDFSTSADAILALEASRDLGLTETIVEKKAGRGPRVQTSSATGERRKPATETSTSQVPTATQSTQGVSGLKIQSAGEGSGGDGDVSANAPMAQTMASDFSGTTLAIASAGSNIRSEARKTDKVLKKLLQAALSGNFEAIKTALIFLDKRASLVTIGMGAQTIKAMQSYEKQMSALSTNIGKLKGTEPDYNAKLAKINSEMNQYSMNRQAISNFLRDTMSMKEEISNLTSSFLTKAGQIASTVSRWG